MSNFEFSFFVNQEKKLRGFQKLLQPDTRQAVMLIEAPKDMGKTWLVGKMQQDSSTAYPAVYLDFRHPREIHEIQDYLGLLRLLRNKLNAPAYFGPFNATVNSLTDAQSGTANTGLATLRRNLETYFSLEELKTLCFDLNITYDNLPGDTLTAKSRELINYSQRNGRISALITLCAEQRTQVDWWLGLEVYRETAVSVTITTTTDAPIADNNAPLRLETDAERRRAYRLLNDAFFECLATYMRDRQQIIFLFDSVEDAPPEAIRWLLEEFLVQLREGKIADVVVIITGRKTPDLTDLNIKHLTVATNLEPFTEDYVREYFEQRRKITGLDWRTIVLTSGGIPGALAMMADHASTTKQEDDDFFN